MILVCELVVMRRTVIEPQRFFLVIAFGLRTRFDAVPILKVSMHVLQGFMRAQVGKQIKAVDKKERPKAKTQKMLLAKRNKKSATCQNVLMRIKGKMQSA